MELDKTILRISSEMRQLHERVSKGMRYIGDEANALTEHLPFQALSVCFRFLHCNFSISRFPAYSNYIDVKFNHAGAVFLLTTCCRIRAVSLNAGSRTYT